MTFACIYAEFMLREALQNNENRTKTGGEIELADRYADDQAMISNTNVSL